MGQYNYFLLWPEEWNEGSISGLVARGGFVVDMQWEGAQLLKAKVHSRIGGVLRIRSYVPLKGDGLKPAEGVVRICYMRRLRLQHL